MPPPPPRHFAPLEINHETTPSEALPPAVNQVAEAPTEDQSFILRASSSALIEEGEPTITMPSKAEDHVHTTSVAEHVIVVFSEHDALDRSSEDGGRAVDAPIIFQHREAEELSTSDCSSRKHNDDCANDREVLREVIASGAEGHIETPSGPVETVELADQLDASLHEQDDGSDGGDSPPIVLMTEQHHMESYSTPPSPRTMAASLAYRQQSTFDGEQVLVDDEVVHKSIMVEMQQQQQQQQPRSAANEFKKYCPPAQSQSHPSSFDRQHHHTTSGSVTPTAFTPTSLTPTLRPMPQPRPFVDRHFSGQLSARSESSSQHQYEYGSTTTTAWDERDLQRPRSPPPSSALLALPWEHNRELERQERELRGLCPTLLSLHRTLSGLFSYLLARTLTQRSLRLGGFSIALARERVKVADAIMQRAESAIAAGKISVVAIHCWKNQLFIVMAIFSLVTLWHLRIYLQSASRCTPTS